MTGRGLTVALTMTLTGCATLGQAPVPETWKTERVNGYFRISMPSEFRPTWGFAIDAYYGGWVSDRIAISFDGGMHERSLSPKWHPKRCFLDGDLAMIGVGRSELPSSKKFPWIVAISKGASDVKPPLTIYAACRSKKDEVLARRILMTIVFPVREAQTN